jgi:ATP-dependent helicase/nuclease subunit A
MKLTPSQSKSLSTERHLAITANAGSGKTRMLVTRYVNLFEQYPDLTTRNVVAITFTENAAAELRERIIEEVSNRLKAPSATEPKQRARLRELRDSLTSAFIGTIHGFASRLLRAYPVEANIDASFAIVTGADQRLLSEDSIERTFYSALEESYQQPTENAVLHLFRTLGRYNITNLMRALLSNRMRAAKVRAGLLKKSDVEILTYWQEEFEHVLHLVVADKTKNILNQATSYLKSGKLGTDALEAIQSFLPDATFFEAATAFTIVTKSLLTNSGTLRANVIDLKIAPSNFMGDLQKWIEKIIPIRALLTACPKSEEEYVASHKEYIAQLRTVFALYDQVQIEYHSTKNEYGLLDFDDLIEKLISLLSNPQLCSEITREFRFLMIDEYQDTDESQFEIARLLTESFGISNNIAIVGDPKQAIYTFRNADAEVFHQTRMAIQAQTLSGSAMKESVELALLPEEEHGSIILAESFRMTRAPLAAINLLFRSLMREGELEYSELINGRIANTQGTVEWICPPEKKKGKLSDSGIPDDEDSILSEDDESNETDLIALKIQSLIQHDDRAYYVEYKVDSEDKLRKAAYGDIAILLRSRSKLRALERSLSAAEIPYVVAKGSGFFGQQEILDITSYLKFLVSPTNDIALAAILRSTFFAVSDVELYQIAHHESARRREVQEPWTFWRQFQSYAESQHSASSLDMPHLTRTVDQLRENLALAGRSSAALLVEKIYAETGIFASLQAGPQPEQKIANLEKFLVQARSADQSGFSGLFDFVERIRYLTESEEQESQAEVSGDLGAVHIMTVHAAKGLEFPIVILPFLQKKFNFDHQHLLDKELGLQIRLSDDRPQPLIAELIHLRSRATTIAEEKRILYVAMTRARDHLILSSTQPEQPVKDSWLSWVCDAFGVPVSDNTLALEENVLRYDSATQKVNSEPFQFEIPLIRSRSGIPTLSPITTEKAIPLNLIFYLDPIAVHRPIGRFSATQLLRFKECPTKYHLSYILGMPEEPKLAYDLEADEFSERVRGPLLGQIVHKLLETVDRIATSGTLDQPSFEHEIHAIFDSLEMVDLKERLLYSNAVRQHVSTFLNSPTAQKIRSGRNTHTEIPLQTLLPSDDTLYGIIDRLFQDQDGTWTVLDYKTEANPNAKNIARYKFQLLFYAYLVHLMYPDSETIRCILFFTATGETTEFQFSNSDFSSFENECFLLIQQIRIQENIPDLTFLLRNVDHCPECRFFDQNMNQCMVLYANPQNPTAIPAM